MSALNNGGIKVAANGVKLGDFLISDKAYQFNGLHMSCLLYTSQGP